MKRTLIFTIAVFCVLAVAAVTFRVFGLDPVAPYIVQPSVVSSAPASAPVGFNFDPVSHTLSVVSDAAVAVVVDLGESFHYEVVWLVAEPRADGTSGRLEYRYSLSAYVTTAHIHPPSATVPPQIQRVVDHRW